MGVLYARVSGAWVPISANAAPAATESSWALVMSSVGAAPVAGNSVISANYRRTGQWVTFSIDYAFGTTFGGGNGDVYFNAPFPAAYTQAITSKLWVPTTGQDFLGGGYVSANRIQPLMPQSGSVFTLNALRNADGTNAAGTGRPQVVGQYPMASPGSLNISGTYRIADGF